MNPIFAQLPSVLPETAEPYYQAFYPACTKGDISAQNAAALYAGIERLYLATDEPVIKSYCLLYYGAVVDTKVLDGKTLASLGQFLSEFLADLEDYRVKTPAGHYVHYLSHAAYLGQAIHEAGGPIKWQPLLAAYLRADIAFTWNEDVVLAECLLALVPANDFKGLLARLKGHESEGAKASNKRALWMAMKVINERAPRHDGTAFSALVQEVMDMVGA